MKITHLFMFLIWCNSQQKVDAMMDDGVNADMDESNMFISAAGGVSHGRVLGFGTMLDGKVQTATNRCRPNYSASSVTVSALTNNSEQESFSRSQVQALLADRDRLRAEDRAEVRRELANYQVLFNQMLSMVVPQGLNVQVNYTNLIQNLHFKICLM